MNPKHVRLIADILFLVCPPLEVWEELCVSSPAGVNSTLGV